MGGGNPWGAHGLPAWGPAVDGMWAYIEDHRMEMYDLSPLYLLGPMGSQSPCRPSSTGSQSHIRLGGKHNLHPAWLFLLDLEEIEVSVPADYIPEEI